MKGSFILLLLIQVLVVRGQAQVLESGGVISYQEDQLLMQGQTAHFADMQLETITLDEDMGKKTLNHSTQEQILILKEGVLEVTSGAISKSLGPNSVLVLMPGDSAVIAAAGKKAVIYLMRYMSKNSPDFTRGIENGGSFFIDFDEITYNPHDKGGIRNYFRKATAMCPYYEMHITHLNAGIKSHEPHTHKASEIVLVIDGKTEMEIGDSRFQAQPGDLYFLPSNVPHAIRNTGTAQAMYFAFQWE